MIKLTDNEPNEKTGPHAPNAPRSRIEDTITLRLPSRDTLPNPLIKELLDFLLEAGKIGIPREKFFSKLKELFGDDTTEYIEMIRNEYITTDEDGLTFFIHPKALFFTTAGKQLIKLVKMAGRIGVSKNVLFKKCIHWHISPVVLSKLREHGHIQYNDEAERFYITED